MIGMMYLVLTALLALNVSNAVLEKFAILNTTLQELKERGFSNPVRVIHSLCGAIVFFHNGMPKEKEGVIDPTKVILVNGASPRTGDPIICRGCGYDVRKNQLEWVIPDA